MRLIDADYLNEYIQTHKVDVSIYTVRTDCKELIVAKDGRWESLLDEIPTAYDVDKVVKEIKKIENRICWETTCDENCKGCAMVEVRKDIIKIVKRGGVNEVSSE